MTRLRPTRALAVALVALTVAACGSSTSSAGPSASSAPAASMPPTSGAPAASGDATSPSASAAASTGPLTTADPNATPLPSLTRVPDLEALLPKSVDGKDLAVASLTGTDIMTTGQAGSVAALKAILKATGGQPSDYAFAYSELPGGSVVGVFRVKGADASKIRDALMLLGKENPNGAIVDSGTIGGKKVQILRVTVGGTETSWYYWPKGDLLYYIQTADPLAAEKFFSALGD
jgi:hypothetical protein